MTTEPRFTDEFRRRLKWLIIFRALFALILLGSTVFFTHTKDLHYDADSLLLLYFISISTLVFSVGYGAALPFIKRGVVFSYLQICIDTVVVTLIVYVTGSFYSAFTFLYLIVVISACFFLLRRGGMFVAALCSIQYGLMIVFEYYGIITSDGIDYLITDTVSSGPYVLYKTALMMIACFAVAFLTSLLVEEERKVRGELLVMKKYVKRVERMAAVGEMAAGLAHEIRNPLAALTGAIEMLEPEVVADNLDNGRLMKIIQREAKRLNSLVNNFLLFAKPHKGNIKRIPLDKILSETLNLFQTGLKQDARIQCLTNISADIWVDMDPEYLRQILWNLLLNAADAITETTNQTGTIMVNLYPTKNDMARLEIIDDGCGMAADLVDVIFDPFFTTKSKGTGLGLSVVHRLVESYGGRIDFESEPGKGTKFVLFLSWSHDED